MFPTAFLLLAALLGSCSTGTVTTDAFVVAARSRSRRAPVVLLASSTSRNINSIRDKVLRVDAPAPFPSFLPAAAAAAAEDGNSGNHQQLPIMRSLYPELPGYQRMIELVKDDDDDDDDSYSFFSQMMLQDGQHPLGRYYGHFVENERIGTLMQLSDSVLVELDADEEEDDNGDNSLETDGGQRVSSSSVARRVLRVVVQAVARLELVDVDVVVAISNNETKTTTQQQIQWYNDEELGLSSSSTSSLKKDKATEEFERWIDWEVRPTKFDSKSTDSPFVSPLINYNYEYFPEELVTGTTNDDDQPHGDSYKNDDCVANLESKVWVALDTMLALLEKASNQPIPVPSQLLVLLPTTNNNNWPSHFRLATYANQLQSRNIEVGTYTTSPFVRVGEASTSYPSLRRASRFSFAIWIVLDSILGNTSSQQKLLETKRLEDRLDMAFEQITSINKMLT
jgi:hypothetical protein